MSLSGRLISRGSFDATRIAEGVRAAYADNIESSGTPAASWSGDIHGHIRPVLIDSRWFVSKRRAAGLADKEHARARSAEHRLAGLTTPGGVRIVVVVPQLFSINDRESALVAPYLGSPLSEDLDLARGLLPPRTLRSLLEGLLVRGVEASGFVPRNMFADNGCLLVIDWEDVRFGEDPLKPSSLTLMKWDIAWSEVYRRDPGFRHRLTAASPADEPDLDEFEQTLASLLPGGSDDVRAIGIGATLESELHVDNEASVSAAQIGHLAEDVLGPSLSVFHTMMTAHLRATLDDGEYAAVLKALWDAIGEHLVPAGKGWGEHQVANLARRWLRALCTAVSDRLEDAEERSKSLSLACVVSEVSALDATSGWTAAVRRAEIVESLVGQIAALATTAFGLDDLQLLLRGSLAQGVLGLSSDVDFELSSPAHPHGHRAIEGVLVELLSGFEIRAEGSGARPSEVDLRGESGITRDLHEWLELRRPGSAMHDPGWLRDLIAPEDARLARQLSAYELLGREHSAKYLWFETRVLLARLVVRESGQQVPVVLHSQIARLPAVVGPELAAEITEVVTASFDHRELGTPDGHELTVLRARVDDLRTALALPGPEPIGSNCDPRDKELLR